MIIIVYRRGLNVIVATFDQYGQTDEDFKKEYQLFKDTYDTDLYTVTLWRKAD